jgi:holliday junction DNA helicase RuvA
VIAQLQGILVTKTGTEAIVDCAGVGYSVNISINTSDKLPQAGEKVRILTLLIPREDSLTLYGFYDEAERETFKLLISVSGVGPKIAMGILSSVSVEMLRDYISSNNLFSLQKLPGIGKKTAERLNLELRDKIIKIIVPCSHAVGEGVSPGSSGTKAAIMRQEAIAALVSLGYSQLTAEKVVKSALNSLNENNINEITVEKLIRISLKNALG